VEEFRNYISSVRRDFADQEINRDELPDSPYPFFEKWFNEAVTSKILDPYAMVISTASSVGNPSTRVVYMRDLSEDGLIFYTNYNSSKGIDIDENPKASTLFFWGELERQIRIQGHVKKVSNVQSDSYFSKRPRASQIGAWASNQSNEISSREELEQKVKEFEQKFSGIDVPRPPHWGGYIISPSSFEFWQGRPSRLHDRFLYSKEGDLWKIKRLSP